MPGRKRLLSPRMFNLVLLVGSIVYLMGRALRAGFWRMLGRRMRPASVVLCYHTVAPEHRRRFAQQMNDLLRWTRPVPAGFSGPLEDGVRYAAVTFDDGFQSVVDNALPELRKRAIPTTIFVPSDNLGEKPKWRMQPNSPLRDEVIASAEQLRQLPSDLVTIGSHTVTHPDLPSVSEVVARKELTQSRCDLESLLNRPVTLFAFPFGTYNQNVVDRSFVLGYLKTRGKRRPWVRRVIQIGSRVFLFDRVFPLAANLMLGVRNLVERQARKVGRTQIREVQRFGGKIDELWATTKHHYEVIVSRDARFLDRRFTASVEMEYRKFVATRDGRTKGYIVLRKRQPVELSGGVIVDLYAARDDEETLVDLIRHAMRFFGREVALIECATSVKEWQRLLSQLGFREVYKTVPVYFCKSAAVRAKLDQSSSDWFLTKADGDWDQIRPG